MIVSFWIAVSTIKDAVKYLTNWKTEIQHVIPEQSELSQPFSPLTGEQRETERSGIKKDAGSFVDQLDVEKSGNQREAEKPGNTDSHLLEQTGDKVTFLIQYVAEKRKKTFQFVIHKSIIS